MSTQAPSLTTPILPGTILAGKFRVEKIIGQGGMGMVVLAHHVALDERVALKFLLPEYAQHPEASERFKREARAASKIKSEHVARVSDVSTLETGAPYMVMEFLEGADLSNTLEKNGPLRVVDAVDYIIQGCEAIAVAHSLGIVHRDLKPANLFLSKRQDGTPIIKVLDFGISKMSGGVVDNLTKTTAAMGSALYMSPEQMQQTRGVDHRTDIYALGIALYELLAGKQPYYADTLPQLCAEVLTGTATPLRSLRPDVGDDLASVVEKAYARDKVARYQSIADFVVALAPWAPSSVQGTIDSVARMAGLPAPIAGQPTGRSATPQSPGVAPPQNPNGGTVVLEAQSYPQPIMQPIAQPIAAHPGYPAGDPRNSPVPPMPAPNPNQIVPGHYSAPISSRAAASFAQGPGGSGGIPANTGSGLATTGRQPSSGGAGLVIGAVLGTLTIAAGLAAFFFLRKPAEAVGPTLGQTAAAEQTATAPPSASVAPPEKTTEVATAKPEDPKAVPSATTTALDPGKVRPGVPGAKTATVKTATPVTPPPGPTATAQPAKVEDPLAVKPTNK